MKKKITLWQRFRYWLDYRMVRGTVSMVKLLLVLVLTAVIFVTLLTRLFHLADGKSLIAAFWDNLRSAMSSSFPASDSGPLLYIILYTLLGLTGMVFTGMLIGIFSSTIRGRIIALQEENPEIIEQDGEQEGPEGCLSVPDVQGFVKRPMHVKVRAQDRNGNWFEAEGEGLLARAFCHELAHLEGQLFTDIMEYEIVPEEEQEEE